MNSTFKVQIPSGFERAFRTFPEIPGANSHWVAAALRAAWATGRRVAAGAFDRTVPLDAAAPGDRHVVLSFSLSREAPEHRAD